MLFNSFVFLIFLPLVFCGYWFIFRKLKIQNLFIVCVSYLFYGWWNWRFLFLIFLTTFLCFIAALGIERTQNAKRKKIICGANIAVNIAILCWFKYFNFFSDNLRLIFEQFGYPLDWFTIDVLLPVGISFYTFQAISYPIDVYRKQIRATSDFIAFTAFISFFPQLVAGPIERSTQLLPQFLRARGFHYDKAVSGMRQILWGFFKKVVIADNCALLANNIFDNYTDLPAPTLWLGAIFFTFQIYGDFSGYSDIAIGVAKLFGIELSRNFHFPYFSRDIAEFWRRWHISLNTWFRDYIYIPLGGSRCSKLKVIRNTLVIFLLSGLWHGANWTFVVWGLYHAVLFIPLLLHGSNRRNLDTIANETFASRIKTFLQILTTFFLVVIGWIIFRAETISQALNYISRSFCEWSSIDLSFAPSTTIIVALMMITIMMAIDWTQRHKSFGLEIVAGKPIWLRWSMYISIILVIMVLIGVQEQFIYFQF